MEPPVKHVPMIRRAADFPHHGRCPGHDWALAFYDGPTSVGDWQCQQCGDVRHTKGPHGRP